MLYSRLKPSKEKSTPSFRKLKTVASDDSRAQTNVTDSFIELKHSTVMEQQT